MIDPTFRNINRLLSRSFKDCGKDPKKRMKKLVNML